MSLSGILRSKRRVKGRAKSEHNAHSRLLSLPPEVRNIICKLVLSGNTLHVFITADTHDAKYADKRLSVSVCKAKPNDGSAAFAIRHCKDATSVPRYGYRHSGCNTTGFRTTKHVPYSLALIETCLQIHTEAAYLPFDENTFSFSDHNSFNIFVKRIYQDQRQHVKSLVLNDSLPFGQWVPMKRFTNLEKVVIFNETYDFGWLSGQEQISRLAEMQHKMLRKLDVFQFSKKLTSAMVCVVVKDWRNESARGGSAVPRQFGVWCEQMEAKLLGSPERDEAEE